MALSGELERVVEQVDQYLAQLHFVGMNIARQIVCAFKKQLQFVMGGLQLEHVLQVIEQAIKVKVVVIERGAASFYFG